MDAVRPDRSESTDGWQVICLCAAWCGVCREWSAVFEALALAHPQVRFDWVDVEDEAEAMGDIDIETFPTLLIAQGRRARFFGPVQPSPTQVGRLLDSLLADPRGTREAAPEAGALLHRLQATVLPKR
ncbi:MAG TPA: thioredoxin family protein [Ramlibacter sp.]|jgi:thioredoxin-like negative regulator of GroEL|uniref:thioredoxin family protein n=1 Tax=Ramlibacter sp. TaxID=1917967 RepID=UPI002D551609|nr:thioredoxin family protein [Ramlibacter sp.]HZY16974.1 thioredoxin family protein [Ramlibacter sp.]